MKNIKSFNELSFCDRKSFYGKAHAITLENGDVLLQSYETVVCGIVKGEFVRFWNDYSATTMRHINAFLQEFYSSNVGGKKFWEAQPVKNLEERRQ